MDRRLFLRNASAFGALAGLSALTPAWARSALTVGPARVEGLAPTVRRPGLVEYDLTIDRTRLAFGGRTGTAVTMNGSVPGPLLRFTEGDEAVIRVHNRLDEMTSVHWHGLILPNDQDGVPHVNFPGIEARSTFEYRYPIRQFGTYWCHSHSGLPGATRPLRPVHHRPRRAGALCVRPRDGRRLVGLDVRGPPRRARQPQEASELLQLPAPDRWRAPGRRRHERRGPADVAADADGPPPTSWTSLGPPTPS